METMTNNNNNNNNKNNSNDDDDDDDDDSQPESNAKADLTVNPVEMILRLRKHASALKQKNGGKTNAEDNDDGIYTDEELHSFISMYVRGDIPDYQMSAWLMAVCFCPLTPRETATLTQCYAESGDLLEWPETLEGSSSSSSSSSSNGANSKGSSKGGSKRRPPLVDKHSSGGVGDKISLILAPLVATCGVAVPMIAGRGLGHTGGTIDKLETSFPGYKVEHSTEDFSAIVLGKGADSPGVGCAIVAAGPELCPADRKIYALRDVTATGSCLSLITASIMSKKIAERPDSLVLDVKHGEGAFMETVEDARLLAESLVAVGEANGLTPTTAFLTDMNHPIGRAVGNWLEVEECIDVMKGNLRHDRLRLGRDLIALVVVQAGQMLYQSCGSRTRTRSNSSGREDAGTTGADDEDENDDDDDDDDDGASYRKYARMSLEECIRHAHEVLDSGKVLETFRRMLLAQGAEATHVHTALDTPGSIPLAKYLAAWVYREEEDAGTEATATATATATVRVPPTSQKHQLQYQQHLRRKEQRQQQKQQQKQRQRQCQQQRSQLQPFRRCCCCCCCKSFPIFPRFRFPFHGDHLWMLFRCVFVPVPIEEEKRPIRIGGNSSLRANRRRQSLVQFRTPHWHRLEARGNLLHHH